MLNVFLTLIFFSSIYILWAWLVRPLLSPLRKIPGPPWTNLFFGHLPFLYRINSKKPCFLEYGRMFRFMSFFGSYRLAVADPEIFKYIHVTNAKNYQKPPLLGLKWAQIIVGRSGLLFSNEHIPIIQNSVERLVSLWRSQISELKNDDSFAELCVMNDIYRMTLDVIGKAAFNFNFNCVEKETEMSKKCLELVSRSAEPKHGFNGFRRVLDFVPFFHYLPSKDNQQFWSNFKWLCQTIHEIIKIKQNTNVKGDDFLDMILFAQDPETSEKLSIRELREECLTFLLTGHETTSLGLCWTLYDMANNLDIQMKCREEIRQKLPQVGFTLEDLQKLCYLDCCIKESLRLHSPVPGDVRQNINDDYVGGYFVPAGTIFILLQGVTHMLPEYWTDPDKYDPDRFLDESKIIPFSFLPFASGPRMCIGYKFALLELKIALVMILHSFEFHPHPDIEYGTKIFITQSPNPSLRLLVKEIKK